MHLSYSCFCFPFKEARKIMNAAIKSSSRRTEFPEVSSFFNNPLFYDVTLLVHIKLGYNTVPQCQRFNVHRLILCSWSEFFRSKLMSEGSAFERGHNDSSLQRAVNECVLVEEWDCYQVFGQFLIFLYTEAVVFRQKTFCHS